MGNEIKDVIVSQFAEDDLNEIAEYYFSLSQNYVEKATIDFEKKYKTSLLSWTSSNTNFNTNYSI